MAKTYLDQLVDYPSKVIQKIGSDKYCVGFLVNKKFSEVGDDDYDKALDEYIYSYQYVDDTVTSSSAYVWVEIEIPSVNNKQIKGVKLYVTVACHKSFMAVSGSTFKGISGNRRDNLVRFIDRLLNNKDIGGIGRLKLNYIKTISSFNSFTAREMCYEIPDFNIVDDLEEVT